MEVEKELVRSAKSVSGSWSARRACGLGLHLNKHAMTPHPDVLEAARGPPELLF